MKSRLLIGLLMPILILSLANKTWALTCRDPLQDNGHFVRGDANGDGSINARDLAYIVSRLHSHRSFSCEKAADVNGDETINFADIRYLMNYLFHDGPPPPLPPPSPQAEARMILERLLNAEYSYASDPGCLQEDVRTIGARFDYAPFYFKTLVLGFGTWPPVSFDSTEVRTTLTGWKEDLIELPGAHTFQMPSDFSPEFILEHISSVPFMDPNLIITCPAWDFWAVILGDLDGDPAAEIWMIQSDQLGAQRLAAD